VHRRVAISRQDPWGGGIFGLEQFVKNGAVIHDSLPQFLDGGLTALRTYRDGLRSSVIVYNRGVIDGDISGTALKISHREATLLHHLTNQLARLRHNILGIIDESAL